MRDFVRDDLHELQTVFENVRSRFFVGVQTFVHVFERDVLESEYSGSIVVGDKDTVHVPDPCLEAAREESLALNIAMETKRSDRPVLQERRPNEIIIFSFETFVTSLELANEVTRVFL